MFRPIAAVALADLKERSRSRTLLVVPVLVAYFVKLVTVDTTLVLAGEYTGELTIAWFAGMTAVIGTTVFLLFGFSLVKGSIARDRETGVGDLVAPSPLSDAQYLLGKWASNVVVLAVATAVLVGATASAFVLQGTGPIDLWALVSPFLLVTLPTMALVAAAAVWFETTRLLRGSVGTAVYFVLALVLVTAGVAPDATIDATGLALVRDSMAQAVAAQYPEFDGTALAFAYTDDPGSTRSFRWDGIAWTTSRLASRLPVLGLAAGLLGLATVSFDRFGDSGNRLLPARWPGRTDADDDAAPSVDPAGADAPSTTSVDVDLAPVEHGGFPVGRTVLAELRMALRGSPWWWYVAALGAVVATAVAPLDLLRAVVVPTALLLLLPAWSSLGARERLHRTEPLVFVGSYPVRLLGATYLAGVLAGVALTVPAPLRFLHAGLYGAAAGWAVGICALPAVALALGVWVGRPTGFEIAYLAAWYLGPINGLTYLDYLGTRDATVGSGVTAAYLVLTAVALGVAVLGRVERN